MTEMALTARQIKVFDRIEADKAAVEKTLKIALVHAENRQFEIRQRAQEMWEELAEQHNIDIKARGYKIRAKDGLVVILEMTDEEVAEERRNG